MSDSDENVPTQEEAEQLCKSFTEVTGTDSACALMFLQQNDWQLEAAVNCFIVANQSPGTKKKLENRNDPSDAPKKQPVKRTKIMSWNIDGLDQNNLLRRARGVAKVINQEMPDIVLLQEVVPQSQKILEETCSDYQFLAGGKSDYYIGAMLHMKETQLMNSQYHPFYSSRQSRGVLIMDLVINNTPCRVMTSHLESTKPLSEERKKQLKRCLDELMNCQSTSLFAGDLNLRDKEIEEIGGLPPGVVDMWEVTGKREMAKFTWDCKLNSNLEMEGRFCPRFRFDRMYIKQDRRRAKLRPVYFELSGIEKIPPPVNRYCSDHWAILGHFDIS
ncbi:DgyrCDS11692 [Dimorphilus gyrociliatus]|uniref:Tyrosyl-DNA phosphodiesterase 2 n=1 Tax=Dimorphilus gyrociliatus TaxID=2664684 RepID=A0A7I8W464_9ANNE|nr:DgyrCDS11692 [Dimorphilus gyrociliatus]